MSRNNCGTCRYWTELPEYTYMGIPRDDWGACHFNPPTLCGEIHYNGELHSKSSDFPKTRSDDWCGQHKVRTS